MKAIRVVPHPDGGRVEVQDVPTPVAGPGQVLVRVRASGLNRGEITQARDRRSGEAVTLGVEFAGEIHSVGSGVTGWREGDRVMGHGRECQAQYMLSDPDAMMRLPSGLGWVEAASFPNAFITAHDALVTNGQLRAGESALINAASGGVAWAAIQIASLWGAKPVIAASRSAQKLSGLSRYGVDVGIDTSRESLLEGIMAATDKRGVDVIVDMVGGAAFEENLQAMAIGGRLVNIARLGGQTAQIDLGLLWLKRLKLIGVTFRTRTERERLACVQACARDTLRWLQQGRIRWAIDSTFPLGEIHAAHAYMMRGEHAGKIVLTVD